MANCLVLCFTIYIDSFFADRTFARCEIGYAEFVDITGAWRSTRRDRLL